MQDNRNGTLVNIPQEYLAALGLKELTPIQQENALRKRMLSKIPKEHQGPILYIGEVVEIKGGKFRITHIKRNRIILKGEPS